MKRPKSRTPRAIWDKEIEIFKQKPKIIKNDAVVIWKYLFDIILAIRYLIV